MNTFNPQTAKHRTAPSFFSIDQTREKVAVFDDEHPGQLSLYLTDDVNFWPARTIHLDDLPRALKILTAWSISRPLVDFRNNKTFALP